MTKKNLQMKWLLGTLMLVAALLMPTVASAAITPSKPTNGDGSSSNPYQISTAAQLYWFAGLVNGTLSGVTKNPAACAKLMANITVNGSVLNSDGTINSSKVSGFTAWTPIGYHNSTSDYVLYTGTFDGNGKTISGLYFNNSEKNYVGLFGYSGGTITNVGIVDSYFYGREFVGGICGLNAGTVKKCYNKCPITSVYNGIAGVCGVNYAGATITNCYNTGSITSDQYHIGGVCGYNYGKLSNCYSTGALLETKGDAGGVCGTNSGSISNCYYDKEKCTIKGINGADASGQAEGKTTAQFTSGEVAYKLQGSQSSTVWGQTIGTDNNPVIGGTKVNYGYLANNCIKVYTNSYVTDLPTHSWDSNGFCSSCNGYQPAEKVSSSHHSELNVTHNGYYAIENAGQLYWFTSLVNGSLEYMSQNASANAVLTTNITVNSNVLKSDGSLNTEKSSGFRVMPQIKTDYSGTFDGNGKTIGGLYKESGASLFQKIAENGILKNLGIVDSYINGDYVCSGLCSDNYGHIFNCYNKSTIKANGGGYGSKASGICGENNGRIESCYNTGMISADSNVGGVCSANYGVIVNCYNTGEINGIYKSGGLVCHNQSTGSIADCYSSGSIIIGGEEIGSICSKNSGTITNCYYDKDKCSVGGINNSDVVGQAEGKTTAQFKSGEMAHLLSKTRDTWDAVYDPTAWGQEIGVDDYPVLGGKRVYSACTNNGLVYANYFRCNTTGHDYNNGFCKLCDSYEPAKKVSTSHHSELNATHNGYYAIENAGQLYWLSALSNGTMTGNTQDLGANAVLTDNITVNKNVQKSDGSLSDDAGSFRVWNPIGYYADESQSSSDPSFYVGTFDGNCKTVSGLYYNRRVSDAEFIGLFGAVGEQGSITNVGVVDSYFNAYAVTGGICGYLVGGTIRNCYNSATVKGTPVSSGDTDFTIGGVCGGLYQGTISNCYNNGAVSGTKNVGAVCGAIEESSPFTFANCYYDNEKCSVEGINNSDALGRTFGKSTAQFSSGEVAYLLSKGYNGSVWGQKLGTDSYPILGGAKVYYGYALNDCQHISYSNTTRTETPNHTYDNGFCTICDGYQPAIKVDGNYAIENAGQLYWFADQVNNYSQNKYNDGAVLVADITVNKGVLNSDGSLSANSSSFRSWPGIGYWTETQSRVLYGKFDGNGHIISGLYSNDANKDYMGLIGYGNCTIQNVGIVDAYFNGKNYVGSICGYNLQGNIVNCYSVSSVAGTSNVGSICGYNSAGEIANCYYDNEKCSIGGVNGSDVSEKTVGKAADKFHNGEVAYLLAHADENETWDYEIWGQQLGVDDYPVGSDYKLVPTALKSEDNTYWATFSDQDFDVTLSVPSARTLKVYNATVSGGMMTLTGRADNQVAFGEGVLLKTDGEYVNVKTNETDGLAKVDYVYNNLVATPFEAETITADAGYTLYRLTYNNVATNEGLGFYLGLVKDSNGNVVSSDGSQLKATPGKAYLKVANSEVKTSPSGAAVRAFVFPDSDDDITGIECITVSDDELRGNGNNSVHDLGGRKVSDSSKGVVVKRGKKVIKN